MELEEIIKKLRESYSLLTRINNLQAVYKINSSIINLLVKLKKINKQLSDTLSTLSVKINSSSDLEEIQELSKEALVNLSKEKREVKRFIPNYRIIKTKEYENLFKYSNIKNSILSTENKIQTADRYIGDLHEPIKQGRYKDCLHARINDNIRIFYFLDHDDKKLIYINLITKNDFENSLNMKPINWKEKFKQF